MAIDQLTVRAFLDSVRSKTPTPGGGAVAAIVGALAASLAQMVVNYSQGKKSVAEYAQLHEEALQSMQALADRAVELAQADATAFQHLSSLWKLEQDDPTRMREWDDAVQAAIDAPLQMMVASLEVLHLLDQLTDATVRSLRSDLAIAALLADAATHAAAWNVRVNLPSVSDDKCAEKLQARVESALDESGALSQTICSFCAM